MDIYASDDEKAEAIKQWWRENGFTVVIAAILSAAAVFGGRYWLVYQQQVAENAAGTYHQVLSLLEQDRAAEAESYTQKLLSDHSSTPYSVFIALEMAARSVDQGDIDTAKTYLEWVIEHAELNGHKQLAKLRLAKLLRNSNQYEPAFALIAETDSTAFASLYAELRGDILIRQAKVDEAKQAYISAMTELSASEPRFMLLKMKLDDLS
jgi:predicted negative regulator of RcsB-dependent stress response